MTLRNLKKKTRTKKPGRPKKSATAQDPSGNLKNRILEATVGLIATRGFDGFTLKDVASSVGVHTALVGYYYGSKAKLERAALDDQLQRIESLFSGLKSTQSLPAEEALRRFFTDGVKTLTHHETAYRFMLWVAAKGGKHFQELNERLWSPMMQTVSDLIRKMVPNLSATQAEARAAAYFALSDSCSRYYWSYGQDFKLGSDREEFLAEYYRMLERRLLPELFEAV